MPRFLIVNADDFGLCEGVNRGIIESIQHGIVTSASLMVRPPAARSAAAYARHHPRLSVGLHLDLGEWELRDGEWHPLYQVIQTDDAVAVQKEIENQIAAFRELVGRDPSHLDSHQHVHRNEPVRSLARTAADQLSIPLRECTSGLRYCGDFYGQDGEGRGLPEAIQTEGLKRILAGLPDGATELGCHPGFADGLNSVYGREREEELRTLCAPEIREWLRARQFSLGSFREWR